MRSYACARDERVTRNGKGLKMKVFKARYDSHKPCTCGQNVKQGDLIAWRKGVTLHLDCAVDESLVTQKDLVWSNPHVEQHVEGEMAFTGDGYTRSAARQAVLSEYAYQPLPELCDCGGVMWYRATSGVLKCVECGEIKTGPFSYGKEV